jgi:hypothetical protein
MIKSVAALSCSQHLLQAPEHLGWQQRGKERCWQQRGKKRYLQGYFSSMLEFDTIEAIPAACAHLNLFDMHGRCKRPSHESWRDVEGGCLEHLLGCRPDASFVPMPLCAIPQGSLARHNLPHKAQGTRDARYRLCKAGVKLVLFARRAIPPPPSRVPETAAECLPPSHATLPCPSLAS